MINYESQIYAENVKALFPFKIVVEEEKRGDFLVVTVKKIEYKTVNGKVYEDVQLLNGNTWKEE